MVLPTATDLAVALERHPGRPAFAEGSDVGRLPAVAGEARVERPVRVVAGEREGGGVAAVATDRGVANCNDYAATAADCVLAGTSEVARP